MVWKNPFQMKNSEEQVREREFLALFDCTVLQMIDEGNFSKVSFVSSTPGALLFQNIEKNIKIFINK